MLDSIFIGMSGLVGFSKGLRVISNNLTNMNSPGFKGAQLQFADLFYQQGGVGYRNNLGVQSMEFGTGLNTLATTLNFTQGELQQTGKASDLAIDGEGYFILRNGDQTRYSRAGQFQFDQDGFLVNQVTGARVAGLDDDGRLIDLSVANLKTNAAKATANVTFSGNISSTASTDVVVDGVVVIDAVGGSHTLKLAFKNNSAATPGAWTVTVTDGGTTVGSGTLQFSGGSMAAGSGKIALTYAPVGVASMPLTLDFTKNVTSFASGNSSTIAMTTQDGYGAGTLTKVAFGQDGLMTASYSNGQNTPGAHLALAQFTANDGLAPVGNNEFISTIEGAAHVGRPQSDGLGAINSGTLEGSNVDMAEEFSNLIVMQRGYQASSHVISTANDMIQELFDMKGHR